MTAGSDCKDDVKATKEGMSGFRPAAAGGRMMMVGSDLPDPEDVADDADDDHDSAVDSDDNLLNDAELSMTVAEVRALVREELLASRSRR